MPQNSKHVYIGAGYLGIFSSLLKLKLELILNLKYPLLDAFVFVLAVD